MQIDIPNYGLEKRLIVYIFYNGLLYSTRMTIDAVVGGVLMNKDIGEAYALI